MPIRCYCYAYYGSFVVSICDLVCFYFVWFWFHYYGRREDVSVHYVYLLLNNCWYIFYSNSSIFALPERNAIQMTTTTEPFMRREHSKRKRWQYNCPNTTSNVFRSDKNIHVFIVCLYALFLEQKKHKLKANCKKVICQTFSESI